MRRLLVINSGLIKEPAQTLQYNLLNQWAFFSI